MLRARVSSTQRMATHLVILASLASRLLALFLDKKVSAPPAMAPDRPALLPDGIAEYRTAPQHITACPGLQVLFPKIPEKDCSGAYRAAMASISTITSLGSLATWTAERAGQSLWKNCW